MMEPGTPGLEGGGGSSLPPPLRPLEVHISAWRRKYQQTLDKLTPHTYQRWAGTAGLVTLFLLRIVFSQGVSSFLHKLSPGGTLTPYFASGISVSFFKELALRQVTKRWTRFLAVSTQFDPKIADAHAIYLLNLLLAFLQPKFDPSIQDDIMADDMEEGGDAPTPLPSSRDDEFRPFVRRLPEWQFW